MLSTILNRDNYWIVDEDGENINIVNNKDANGTSYLLIDDDLVYRIDSDEFVEGEFTAHKEPFILC